MMNVSLYNLWLQVERNAIDCMQSKEEEKTEEEKSKNSEKNA